MVAADARQTVIANGACMTAMILWATGFPAGEVLLDSWGSISLLSVRMLLGTLLLMTIWLCADGIMVLARAPWSRAIWRGGIGFGIGSILLLVGQKLSDPVTPAIAAAMMPIAGAVIEVALDQRRLRLTLVAGMLLAVAGGLISTGVNLTDAGFGSGAAMCIAAIFLFAWATRSATRDFIDLSVIGRTAITLAGAAVFVQIAYGVFFFCGFGEVAIGRSDSQALVLLVIFALISAAIAQLLWIWGASGLGILVASFHMNAVPFYVMAIVALALGGTWSWQQAAGALLVGIGVVLSQMRRRKSVSAGTARLRA